MNDEDRLREDNTKLHAAKVAAELREIASWLEKCTGGTNLVAADVGGVDVMLDTLQLDQVDADLSDSARWLAVDSILRETRDIPKMMRRIRWGYEK